jgi:hypothetical protein
MKKFILSSLVAIFTIFNCYAQDVIMLNNGKEIQSKVVEITTTQIQYRKFENLDRTIYSLDQTDALFIRYENGRTEVFSKNPISDPIKKPVPVEQLLTTTTAKFVSDPAIDNYCEKGKSDANVYYTGQNCGAGGTSITTILFSPLIGLIPYSVCISTPPTPENLHYPSIKLYENIDYRNCYTAEAHTIKKRKQGLAIGMSSAIWLGLILLINSSAE